VNCSSNNTAAAVRAARLSFSDAEAQKTNVTHQGSRQAPLCVSRAACKKPDSDKATSQDLAQGIKKLTESDGDIKDATTFNTGLIYLIV
jgi:hypothetical protein